MSGHEDEVAHAAQRSSQSKSRATRRPEGQTYSVIVGLVHRSRGRYSVSLSRLAVGYGVPQPVLRSLRLHA